MDGDGVLHQVSCSCTADHSIIVIKRTIKCIVCEFAACHCAFHTQFDFMLRRLERRTKEFDCHFCFGRASLPLYKRSLVYLPFCLCVVCVSFRNLCFGVFWRRMKENNFPRLLATAATKFASLAAAAATTITAGAYPR